MRLLRRCLLATLPLVAFLTAPSSFAQTPVPGWLTVLPSNPRYFEIAPPGGFPYSLASYGSGGLVPCTGDYLDMVNDVAYLGNQGANYVRIWSWWVCDEALTWGTKHGPWALAPDTNNLKWDLETFDEVYWDDLRGAIRAARGGSPRLAVEVQVFRRQDWEGKRADFNPLMNDANGVPRNIQGVSVADDKALVKIPYWCKEAANFNNACDALGVLEDYVDYLVDQTQEYGNVTYQLMNEPFDCQSGDGICPAAQVYFAEYWAGVIKARLAGFGKSRPIAHDAKSDASAFEVPDVDVANIFAFQDLVDLANFLPDGLAPLAAAVRNGYLQHDKVVNVDELGNAERDPAKLRKEAWTIIASGGHFHIEDPCNPGVSQGDKCKRPDGTLFDAKPWVPVQNIAKFKTASGWQFNRGKPIVGSGPSKYFFWMVQGDPQFDTIGFTSAGVQDHVGYLANRPATVCTTGGLEVDLPAMPAGAIEYVAWLWDPSMVPTTDSYLKDPQGHRIEYRFTWNGGLFDWCDTPEAFRNAMLGRNFPSDDLVFQVHAVQAPLTTWRVVGAGDFNGDLNPDLVWQRDDDGRLEVWLMQGATVLQRVEHLVPDRPSADGALWEVRAVADFNSDGNADILWQHRTLSAVVIWLMNRYSDSDGSLTLISRNTVGQPASGAGLWKIAATSDFNSDGHRDLLWQHQTGGNLVAWLMNGVTHSATAFPSPNQPANEFDLWKVRAAADFNQDGHPDLLWQRDIGGNLVVWYMDGLTKTAANPTSPNQPYNEYDLWKVVTASDFNADGSPDLLWQRIPTATVPNAARVIWYMNGIVRTGLPVGLPYSPPN